MVDTKTKNEPPLPHYYSRRLLGLEIEIDAGGGAKHDPILPTTWKSKPDGSLFNGAEYILDPPQPLIEALPSIKEFSEAVIKAKMHVSIKGGYHIHVQAADYEFSHCLNLAKTYQHYQKIIDQLVGNSRRSSNAMAFNYHFSEQLTEASLKEMFRLDFPARTRDEAKGSRARKVVNFAMIRCTEPLQRTIEFRQPSSSKKTINIWGWACLAAALVDFAKDDKRVNRFLKRPPTIINFLALLRGCERKTHAKNLVNWVNWRLAYLTNLPENGLIKISSELMHKPKGIFSIARMLNLNLAVTKKLIDQEVEKGNLIEVSRGKWKAGYCKIAENDLQIIIKNWALEEVPVTVQEVPVQPRQTP